MVSHVPHGIPWCPYYTIPHHGVARVPRVLGRQLQDVVSYAVGAWLQVGNFAVMTRDEEGRTKAKLTKAKKERACRLLAGLANRHLKAGFEDLAVEVRHLRRERLAFRLAELDSRRAPGIWAMQDQRKAEAVYAERLKCPKFREEVDLARIEEQKKAQARNVAFHAARKEEKKAEAARVAEEKKRLEADVAFDASEPEEKRRRI